MMRIHACIVAFSALLCLPLTARAVAPDIGGCAEVTTTFSSTDTPKAIPDAFILPPLGMLFHGTVNSTIAVGGAGTYIIDVDVTTAITHTWNANLDITLTSPAGTTIPLTTDNGGRDDNVFNGTLWDDQADDPVTDHLFALNTPVGHLNPESALGAFKGENPNGAWTVSISDDTIADVGTLNGWSLIITVCSAGAPGMQTTGLSTTPAQAIPDQGTIESMLLFQVGGRSVCGLRLTTDISHPNSQDLDITLQSPHGRTATITTGNGGVLDDIFAGTVWDDHGMPNTVTDHAWVDGVAAPLLVPEEALSLLDGLYPNGRWTLIVSDNTANGFTGSLNSWGLEVTACDDFGACCGTTSPCSCIETTRTACEASGGVYRGDLTSCVQTTCGVDVFGNLGDFQAKTSIVSVEDFEESPMPPVGVALCNTGLLDIGHGGSCFTPGDLLPGVHFSAGDFMVVGDGYVEGPIGPNSTKSLANRASGWMKMTFDVPGHGVGFDVGSGDTTSTTTITAFGAGDVPLSSSKVSTSFVRRFFGVTAQEPIAGVTIWTTGGDFSNAELIDNVRFGGLRDTDADGISDEFFCNAPCSGGMSGGCFDNCTTVPNGDQADPDGDGVGNACDSFATTWNPGEPDADGDGTGDACDPCASDPGKLIPGVCGCGTADTDGNVNGVTDCLINPEAEERVVRQCALVRSLRGERGQAATKLQIKALTADIMAYIAAHPGIVRAPNVNRKSVV